jgi:AraC-like DNA-binding protein
MRKTGAPESSEGVLREAAGDGTREYMRLGRGAHGLERVEWRFVGQAFSPHRHDSYAIGLTLEGVQTFWYRGARRISLPGECHVLHPDELHDGGAGSAAPFAYRIAYVDPTLVQAQLGGSPLPFVTDPVVRLTDAQRRRLSPVWDLDDVLDEMAFAEVGAAIVDFLLETSGSRSPRTALPIAALERARALLCAEPATPHSAAELERATGLDRWTLARQFRAAFGTSPTRYRTMRQLDHVRRAIRRHCSLAEASHAAGFCDQSHMTRMFTRVYGVPPARWGARVATAHEPDGIQA